MKLRCATILVVMLAGGCSATVTPPPAPHDAVTIYLTDYGRHSSLILPNPTGGLTEYAWADWDWFALGDAHWYMIPRTMLFSPQATLCERNVDGLDNANQLKEGLGAEKATPIRVLSAKVQALRDQLNELFSSRSLTLVHSNYSNMWHVKDNASGHYWLMHNCNHETARWLKEMGCKVKGEPMLSHFNVNQSSESQR
jgi:hypothetical protein